MQFLKLLPFHVLLKDLRFASGIFYQGKTSRKNWRVPCQAGLLHLIHGNRLVNQADKTGNSCMSADLFRTLYIARNGLSALHLLRVNRSTSTFFYFTFHRAGCKDRTMIS